jgi:hypothetical protein
MTSSKNGHVKPILRAGEIGTLHSQILALYPLLCPSVHSEIAQPSVKDTSATGGGRSPKVGILFQIAAEGRLGP